ncbi:hypothetical protein LRP88_10980 [Fusarium phalaenopsidis]
MNTIFAGFSFKPRENFQPLFPNVQFTRTEKYKICLVVPPRNGQFIERATEDVHIAVVEVTTFDEYNLSEPAEKQPAGFFPNAGSFGVKGVPKFLNAPILMYTGDQWSIIYVDQSSQSGQVAILQPQEYYLFWKERAENEKLHQMNEADRQQIIFNAGETSKGIHLGFKNPGTPEASSWYFT